MLCERGKKGCPEEEIGGRHGHTVVSPGVPSDGRGRRAAPRREWRQAHSTQSGLTDSETLFYYIIERGVPRGKKGLP
jgi:hypothetical protein